MQTTTKTKWTVEFVNRSNGNTERVQPVKKKLRYVALYEDFCAKISEGVYSANTYLPAERKICDIYGVGRITVRNALEMLEHDGKIKKIHGAGSLVLPSSGSEIKNGTTKTVAFVASRDFGDKLRQPFIEMLLHNIERACNHAGIKVFSVTLSREDAMLDMLLDKSICNGILFVGSIAEKFINAAMQAEMPTVLISDAREGLVSINASNESGSFDATEYLISKNSRKIAFISGIQSSHNSTLRQLGYKRALLCNGLLYDETLVGNGDWGYDSGYNAMIALLETHGDIDGVIAANDMMAYGAIKALIQAGRKIPEDVQVFGFDNIEQGMFPSITLSTVGVDTHFLSVLAVGFIENQSNGHSPKGNINLSTNLILRETTRA